MNKKQKEQKKEKPTSKYWALVGWKYEVLNKMLEEKKDVPESH